MSEKNYKAAVPCFADRVGWANTSDTGRVFGEGRWGGVQKAPLLPYIFLGKKTKALRLLSSN